jgi:CRP-like cAMP-binding protein
LASIGSEESGNRLLNFLSVADRELLSPALRAIALKPAQPIEASGQPVEHVLFVLAGIVSVVAVGTGDRDIEVGIIGREGMTGLVVVLGNGHPANRTFVQVAGRALSIDANDLRRAMDRSSTLRLSLLRFVQAFMVQTSQTARANGRATLEARLARWLLMAHDRLDGNDLPLTHEFLSIMLGVRRPGVTVALQLLQDRGLITAGRGLIRLVDRDGLVEIASDWYGLPESELSRLLQR